MSFLKQSNLALIVLLCVVIGIMMNVTRGKSSSDNATQDVSSLDRRISLLEQRFYSVESSISRLQQLTLAQRPVQQPSASDAEMNLIREEIRKLHLQLSEIECGLVKLGERTTTRRSNAPRPTDPCRLNSETPLRLSTRAYEER